MPDYPEAAKVRRAERPVALIGTRMKTESISQASSERGWLSAVMVTPVSTTNPAASRATYDVRRARRRPARNQRLPSPLATTSSTAATMVPAPSTSTPTSSSG